MMITSILGPIIAAAVIGFCRSVKWAIGLALVTVGAQVLMLGVYAVHGLPEIAMGVFRWNSTVWVMGIITVVSILASVVLASRDETVNRPSFYALLMLTQAALMGVFSAKPLVLFYVFWEAALIPVLLMGFIWGNRFKSTMVFFLYTLAASMGLLVGILGIMLTQSDPYWLMAPLAFVLFFIPFAVKTPVFPFHSWQPNLYGDMPLPIVAVLMGVFSKMGIYGFIQFMPWMSELMTVYGQWVIGFVIFGVLASACLALVQTDIKRFAAYASMSHLGAIVVALLCVGPMSLKAVLFQSVMHTVAGVGLLLGMQVLIQTYGTTDMRQMGGFYTKYPRFTGLFFVVLLSVMAFPLTGGFVGEFLVLSSIYSRSMWMAVAVGITVILGAAYTLRFYRMTCLGTRDAGGPDRVSKRVFVMMGVVVIVVLGLGLFSDVLLDRLTVSPVLTQPAADEVFSVL